MTNIRNAFQRSLLAVAVGVGDKLGLEVRFSQASTACTNGKTIVIPTGAMKKSNQALIWGFLVHEASHIRFTDFNSDRTREAATQAGIPAAVYSRLCNALEDAMIERRITEDFPGYATDLREARGTLVREGCFPPPEAGRTYTLLELIHSFSLLWCFKHCTRMNVYDEILPAWEDLLVRTIGPERADEIKSILSENASAETSEDNRRIVSRLIECIKSLIADLRKVAEGTPAEDENGNPAPQDKNAPRVRLGSGFLPQNKGPKKNEDEAPSGNTGESSGQNSEDSNGASEGKPSSQKSRRKSEKKESGEKDNTGSAGESDSDSDDSASDGNSSSGTYADDVSGDDSAEGKSFSEKDTDSENTSEASSETETAPENENSLSGNGSDFGKAQSSEESADEDADGSGSGTGEASGSQEGDTASQKDGSSDERDSSEGSDQAGAEKGAGRRGSKNPYGRKSVSDWKLDKETGESFADAVSRHAKNDKRKADDPSADLASILCGRTITFNCNTRRKAAEHYFSGHPSTELPDTKHLVGRIARVLKNHVYALSWAERANRNRGRSVDLRRIGRILAGDMRVFSASAPHMEPDCAVKILVDLSGSMNNRAEVRRPAETALAGASAIRDAFEMLAPVPVSIDAFGSDVQTLVPWGEPRAESMKFLAQVNGFMDEDGMGCTELLLGTAYSGLDLLMQKKKRKLLLIVTDGFPSDCQFKRDGQFDQLTRELRENGVETFMLGIGMPKAVMENVGELLGKKNAAAVRCVEDLPDAMFGMIRGRMSAFLNS